MELFEQIRKRIFGNQSSRGRSAVLGTESVGVPFGQGQLLADLFGDPEDPTPLSVSVDCQFPTITDTNTLPRSLVVIDASWGNDGIHSATIDAVRGSGFAVPGQRLRLSARAEALVTPVTVSVSVSPGKTLAGAIPPSRTIYPTVPLAFGATVDVKVPAYARTLRVFRIPESVPITVSQRTTFGSLAFSTALPGNAQFLEVPIVNGADTIRIQNDSGATDITSLGLWFGLAL